MCDITTFHTNFIQNQRKGTRKSKKNYAYKGNVQKNALKTISKNLLFWAQPKSYVGNSSIHCCVCHVRVKLKVNE
jgi:hypothetical protein